MFIAKEDLKGSMYDYQIDQITDGDDTIVLQAIAAAQEEMSSLLCKRYDVELVFTASGSDRNALLISLATSIAAYRIAELCNAEVIWEQVRQRYDRAIKYLNQLASGEVDISSLPAISSDADTSESSGIPRSGSRVKFKHEF